VDKNGLIHLVNCFTTYHVELIIDTRLRIIDVKEWIMEDNGKLRPLKILLTTTA